MIYLETLYKIVFFEIFILSLASVSIISFYFYIHYNNKRIVKIQAKILNIILTHYYNHKKGNIYLNKKERKPKYLIPAIEEFNQKIDDPQWDKIKDMIFKKYLRMDLHKMTRDRNWTKRLLAARGFALNSVIGNENDIIRLLNDKLIIINITVIPAAINLSTSRITKTLIEIISKESRFSGYTYKDALFKGKEKIYYQIEDILRVHNQPEIRKACLDILQFKTHHNPIDFIEKDLQSDDLELRIAAVKVLGNYPSNFSIKWLKKMSKDEKWQVRALVPQSLGKLNVKKTIPLLMKLMMDEQWWVRFNAANAILEFGDLGMKVLKNIDPDIDKYAYETAQYVFSINNEVVNA